MTGCVGVDLGTPHQRDADALLVDLAAHLAAAGAGGRATLMTHRAATSSGVHVALSVDVGPGAGPAGGEDPDDGALWALLADAPALRGHAAGTSLAEGSRGRADLAEGAAGARAAALARSGGRAVSFPGAEHLTGELTVAQVLERSAVQRVAVLAAGTAEPDRVVVTRGFVRPTCSDGELVLLVQPAVGGTLVPFEVANPTPCCLDHA